MRVFVTGATGFVGSAVVRELIDAGHQVLGLTRNPQGAESLAAAGAQAHPGDLKDLESLRSGARDADAVIHLAFNHDFSKFRENCETDRKAIETLGEALAGSGRSLIVTSGLAVVAQGDLATEEDPPVSPSDAFPRASEPAANAFVPRDVRAMIVRLPQVHDTTKQGLITYSVQIAREQGVSPYIGEGQNRWAAVHVSDAAHLYRLALEKGQSGARYHAIAEEGVTAREIAEAIGRGLKLPARSVSPEQAGKYLGWLAPFAALDLKGSSARTREQLGWKPTGPILLEDLESMFDQKG